METLQKELEALGHEVEIPLLDDETTALAGDRKVNFAQHIADRGGIDAFAPTDKIWDIKEGAIKHHFKKEEWCDAVLIANYDKNGIEGYVGGNTLIEIAIAYYLKKPIYILNPVSSELSYKVEILGMKPTFLNGDLKKISG